jgi:glyoxylase-like metal-dependent hydrolase (beta-lactamase superfamily II)
VDFIFEQIRTGGDRNFGYLVGDRAAGLAAAVDPSFDPDRVLERAEAQGLRLTTILNTHGHADHTNGNEALKGRTGAEIAGHPASSHPVDRTLADGEALSIGSIRIRALHVPGHCPDHLLFHLPDHAVAITGDLLFVGKVGGDGHGRGRPHGVAEPAAGPRGAAGRDHRLARPRLRLPPGVDHRTRAPLQSVPPVRRPRGLPRAEADLGGLQAPPRLDLTSDSGFRIGVPIRPCRLVTPEPWATHLEARARCIRTGRQLESRSLDRRGTAAPAEPMERAREDGLEHGRARCLASRVRWSGIHEESDRSAAARPRDARGTGCAGRAE